MIYIIDHQDSFTWNVVHQFSQFDKVHCSDYFDINKKLLKNVRSMSKKLLMAKKNCYKRLFYLPVLP